MLKHLVPLLYVGVHRDITTTLQAQVAEYEIPILQSVHGDSNVYPGDSTGTEAAIDADGEYERLCRRYGTDFVRDAYGATAKGDIRRQVLAVSVGTVEDKGYGIQLDGPDTPVAPRLSLPAADVQRPPPDGKSGKARAAAMA